MNTKTFAKLAALAAAFLSLFPTPTSGAPMKARVIQQLFSENPADLKANFDWTINELKKCDGSLDIIVLPEFSEVPAKTLSSADWLKAARENGPVLLETCAQTARRCGALVFAGAVDTSLEVPRNTIFVFDRQGEIIGRYYKEHLTRGEWDKLDMRYTEEWTQPYILDIEGVRYAFLTCYDFYFYENYSNIARWKPDVIIGASHQRSDTFRALDIINSFCAYNTGAYLVRASVSMGLDSELGGCSCVVAPTGEILGVLRSEVATLDVTFDPKKKYLKPAGYGNPPALHSEYIEIGRRPWKYRPGGGAIVPPLDESPSRRLCAQDGLSKGLAMENPLASLGAAVAAGASEIGFPIRPSKDGKIIYSGVPEGTEAPLFEEILKKLSCHAIMNIQLDKSASWSDEALRKVMDLIFIYDATAHVYLTSPDEGILKKLAAINPKVARCLLSPDGSDCVSKGIASGCSLIQIPGEKLNKAISDKAREAGLSLVVQNGGDASWGTSLFAAGASAVVTTDWQAASKASGIK